MSSRLLSVSLALNLVLLGAAGYWAARDDSDGNAPPGTETIPQTNRVIARSPRSAPISPAVTAEPTPLRWSELESEDYSTYVANLRGAGCPEPVLRRIISAEIKELYAQKGFALVQEFHRDFWIIAAKENVRGYMEKMYGQKVKALCKESEELIKQLLGEESYEPSGTPATSLSDGRLTNFLSPSKQEQLRRLVEHYDKLQLGVRQADLSPGEKEFRLAKLRTEMEREQAAMLTPEEWSEYQLRQSGAATELQQLHGVDFSETELRNMAKAIDDYRRTDSQLEHPTETLDQKLQTVLGPERFADLNRARSASYRELCEIVSDFGKPIGTAAEIFDLRLGAEKQSDEIRADKNRSIQEKQALLDDLHDQVERAVVTKFGAGDYQNYKATDGQWIHSLGRL